MGAVTMGGFRFSPKTTEEIETAKNLTTSQWFLDYDGTQESYYTLSAFSKSFFKLAGELAPKWNGKPEFYEECAAPFGTLAKLTAIPYGRFLVGQSDKKIVKPFKEGCYAEGIKNLAELVGVVANGALTFAFIARLDCCKKLGTYAVLILTISDLTAIYQEAKFLIALSKSKDEDFADLTQQINANAGMDDTVSNAEVRSQLKWLSIYKCAKIVIAPLTLASLAFGSKGPALTNLGNRVIVSAVAMLGLDFVTRVGQLRGKRYEAGLYLTRKVALAAPAA